MNKSISRNIAAAALMLTCGITANAQELKSGYFMEGYTYRHMSNPALEVEKNYIAIPAIGNINAGTQGNVGLATFLYPKGNELTTFMNSSVDADEFLGKLKKNNRINANVDLTILSAGFKGFGGYNTIDLSVRSHTSIRLPKGLFEFMKLGMQGDNSTYVMDDLGVSSSNYAQLAFGHSRDINEKLRVGAKAKLLFGLAHASVKMTDMRVDLHEDAWRVRANGEMNVALKGLTLPTKGETGSEVNKDSEKDLVDWGEIDHDGFGLSGFGVAFDLGAVYKINEDWTVSASLLDLGFISWSNNTKAVTSNKPWEFKGFHNIAVDSELGDDDPNSLDSQLDNLGKDLEDYASFHRTEQNGSSTDMLGATLTLGAEYKLPVYNRLSFGLLSTTRIQGAYSWTEGRLSANISPVSWFDAGANVAVSTLGTSFGGIINFNPTGFNFFVGMDYVMSKVSKQYIPLNNMNMNVSLGMNIVF